MFCFSKYDLKTERMFVRPKFGRQVCLALQNVVPQFYAHISKIYVKTKKQFKKRTPKGSLGLNWKPYFHKLCILYKKSWKVNSKEHQSDRKKKNIQFFTKEIAKHAMFFGADETKKKSRDVLKISWDKKKIFLR